MGAGVVVVSIRKDILDAVVTRVNEILNPTLPTVDVPVAIFEGDSEVFNKAATYPSVYVMYGGRGVSENETIGSVNQRREFVIFVLYAYTVFNDLMQAMEDVETGLPGELGATDRLIESAEDEELLGIDLERQLYVQVYTVEWDG